MSEPAPQTAPEWLIAPGLTDYSAAVAAMEAHVAAMNEGRAGERIWLVEHPPLYTAGTSARSADLLEARFPVHETGRGGQYTYHGPGQRVVYTMLDLNRRGRDVRAFVHGLESWVIDTLAEFGVTGDSRRPGRRLGRTPRQAAPARWLDARRQDRRYRHQVAPLGQFPRHFHQC